ncbi:hypothetical protein [Planomonospora venezuelensis]|uniref:Uncharacterized protein n=1 Tax=Planomonospora venezuelensis TaxID=1999 RepID=A0A841D406_PLAVE|nr:hypothetical protein [Planomonospora venezuelensis]MBB5963234.1 hypothetical protein [Planomonospora venezuelensis]GIN01348.1 hypothetical protein Pve01_30060 [Planomonospora venezuelensis]
MRLVHRYRFGPIAAFVAAGYVLTLIVAAVIAPAGGDGFLRRLVFPAGWSTPDDDLTGWAVLPLALAGGVQGWALWQILRGWAAGERPPSERRVRRLRGLLYADLLLGLTLSHPFDLLDMWWVDILWSLGQLAIVVLFHRVLADASRMLRLTALAAGTLTTVAWQGRVVCGEFGFDAAERIFDLVSLDGLTWGLWMVTLLVAQAGDGRWDRSTVWIGATGLAMSLLVMPVVSSVILSSFSFSGNGLAPALLSGLYLVSNLLMPVWTARSAHDLAGTPAGAVPRPERPAPLRAPLGPWPLPVAAVLLPLLPAAVNLAHGVPFWLGPQETVVEHLSGPLPRLWLCADLLAGAGGLGVLALAAVVRRTRGRVRTAAGVLLLAAAAGAAMVLTTPAAPAVPDPTGSGGPSVSNVIFGSGGPEMYPDWVFAPGEQGTEAFLGISPLWHSAAFTFSALILLFRYGRRPARRSPYRTALAAAVPVLALGLLPAADHARGPLTSKEECERLRSTSGPYGQYVEPPPLGPELAFVCDVRASEALPGTQDEPDPALVAYGRRLCGVYTRGEAGELARVRAAGGVDVRGLTYVIDEICPSADEVVRAEQEEEERELQAWEAEQRRMCDEAPRHRPRIRPASATVVGEPVWTDYGVLEAYEEASDNDPFEDGLLDLAQENELTAALPGHLMVLVHSDAVTCVTTETYTRRPPVETKGWQHVVEVGYRSPGGEIVLGDPMGGSTLPDLALRGRSGDYRIRVHYAWLPWKGEKYGAQRLLIMAYPGRGDDVVVHRERTRP